MILCGMWLDQHNRLVWSVRHDAASVAYFMREGFSSAIYASGWTAVVSAGIVPILAYCVSQSARKRVVRMGLIVVCGLALRDLAKASLGVPFVIDIYSRRAPFIEEPIEYEAYRSLRNWVSSCANMGMIGFVALVIIYAQKRSPGDEAPHCEDCGYSLRGLPEPRCPECGRVYTPEEFGALIGQSGAIR